MNAAEWITALAGIPAIVAVSGGVGVLFYASVRPWLARPSSLPVPAAWRRTSALIAASAFAALCMCIGLGIWPRP